MGLSRFDLDQILSLESYFSRVFSGKVNVSLSYNLSLILTKIKFHFEMLIHHMTNGQNGKLNQWNGYFCIWELPISFAILNIILLQLLLVCYCNALKASSPSKYYNGMFLKIIPHIFVKQIPSHSYCVRADDGYVIYQHV